MKRFERIRIKNLTARTVERDEKEVRKACAVVKNYKYKTGEWWVDAWPPRVTDRNGTPLHPQNPIRNGKYWKPAFRKRVATVFLSEQPWKQASDRANMSRPTRTSVSSRRLWRKGKLFLRQECDRTRCKRHKIWQRYFLWCYNNKNEYCRIGRSGV